MNDLTPKQQEVYDFMVSYEDDHGEPPLQRIIAAKFGITQGALRSRMVLMEKKGYIKMFSRYKIIRKKK